MKKNKSLKARLWVNSSLNLLLMVLVSVLGIYALLENTKRFEQYSGYSNFSAKMSDAVSDLMSMRIEVYKYLLNDDASHLDTVAEMSGQLGAKIKELSKGSHDLQQESALNKLSDDLNLYAEYAKKVPSLQGEARSAFISNEYAPLGNQMMAVVVDQMDKTNNDQIALSAQIKSSNGVLLGMIVAVAIVSFIIAIFLSIILANSVVKSIQSIINSLTHSSTQVGSAANEISSSSQSLAEASSEQAATIEETSASMEEISSMVKSNVTAVEQVRDRSAQATESAKEGNKRMEDLKLKLSSIRDAGNALKEAMGQISKSSKEVAVVAATIDEIAFQTNLLSLNAAVEAARAGEAGAGFAVVAGEVGQLAQRSAQNATQTTQLIAQSEESSKAGVVASDDVLKSLDAATVLFEEVIQAFASITSQIQDVSVHTEEVRQSSVQQSEGIEQINTAVSQLDQVIQQNAATSEESAGAAAQLTTQSDQLRRMVEQLREIVYGSDAVSDFNPSNEPVSIKMFPEDSSSRTITPENRSRSGKSGMFSSEKNGDFQ